MFDLEKMGKAIYRLPKTGGMRVPGLLIANEELLRDMVNMGPPLEQVCNVAFLPGIQQYSIAMPDIHWGYGFPIGGVAAMDLKEGVISPGGIGYDINCGVRLAIISHPFKKITDSMKRALINHIYALVPSGVGRGQKGKRRLSDSDYKSLIQKGVRWSIEQGDGFAEDIEHVENCGFIEGGALDMVSSHARERGSDQLGTIGSGNHFVEVGQVKKIFLKEVASAWDIEEGMTYLLIHSGSRGFGHQICQDSLTTFIRKGYHKGLPDRQLVCAPIQSQDGRNYLSAMAAAANFAFNNRQKILHEVRKAFQTVCSISPHEVRLLYDVCHNIAKIETHQGREVCVLRKGATRAYGPGAKELIPLFQRTGQPVIVPGDMGRASYLLVGLGNPLTFCSSCHGAGRARSRLQALKSWKGRDTALHMQKRNVLVRATSARTIAEEMPDAYKDVAIVVKAVEEAELANRVASLSPHIVLKG